MLRRFHPTLFLGEPDLIVNHERTSPSEQSNPSASSLSNSPAEIVVHVAGAVQSPGVYRLSLGARVLEAIEKAGGATERADIHRLNLAAKVRDGQQITVPEQRRTTSSSVGANQPPFRSSASNPPTPEQKLLIDLNVATLEQLQTLPRIGPVIAQRIIEYRETHGPFSSADDLTKVRGIGDKTLEKIRHLVVIH